MNFKALFTVFALTLITSGCPGQTPKTQLEITAAERVDQSTLALATLPESLASFGATNAEILNTKIIFAQNVTIFGVTRPYDKKPNDYSTPETTVDEFETRGTNVLLSLMESIIGLKCQSFVADRGFDAEIWNYASAAFRIGLSASELKSEGADAILADITSTFEFIRCVKSSSACKLKAGSKEENKHVAACVIGVDSMTQTSALSNASKLAQKRVEDKDAFVMNERAFAASALAVKNQLLNQQAPASQVMTAIRLTNAITTDADAVDNEIKQSDQVLASALASRLSEAGVFGDTPGLVGGITEGGQSAAVIAQALVSAVAETEAVIERGEPSGPCKGFGVDCLVDHAAAEPAPNPNRYDAVNADAIALIALKSDPLVSSGLKKALDNLEERKMSFGLEYLGLQEKMRNESRQYETISRILKTKHDTVKNSINNVR